MEKVCKRLISLQIFIQMFHRIYFQSQIKTLDIKRFALNLKLNFFCEKKVTVFGMFFMSFAIRIHKKQIPDENVVDRFLLQCILVYALT